MIQAIPLPQIWILDACSALNFAASGQMEAILRVPFGSQHRQYTIAEIVIAEASHLRRGGNEEDAHEREAIDWDTYVNQGWLRREAIANSDELKLFVELATQVDDGEAMTLALAASRGYGVVTDDRKAQKLLGFAPFVDTLHLLSNWNEKCDIAPEELQLALRKITARANFLPPRSHPLKNWWIEAAEL